MQPQPPPVDPGNSLLAETPAMMTVALAQTPVGQRLTVTIRTTTTTLSVFLDKATARAWSTTIKQAADTMSAGGLIAANGGQVKHG